MLNINELAFDINVERTTCAVKLGIKFHEQMTAHFYKRCLAFMHCRYGITRMSASKLAFNVIDCFAV